eukprot:1331743-Pleurochrysis_carterae.AAC.4
MPATSCRRNILLTGCASKGGAGARRRAVPPCPETRRDYAINWVCSDGDAIAVAGKLATLWRSR